MGGTDGHVGMGAGGHEHEHAGHSIFFSTAAPAHLNEFSRAEYAHYRPDNYKSIFFSTLDSTD
jgi:hypothetical protein